MQATNLFNQKNYFDQLQGNQKQCHLCMNLFTRTNHPIKVCPNDHNMCERCVQQKLFLQPQNDPKEGEKTVSCPFCESRIDQRKFVINYKLLNSMKNSQQNQNAVAVKYKPSWLQKLSQQNYRIIMSFLYQNQKIQLSSTNIFLRSLLMTDQIWGEFHISDCLSMNLQPQSHQENWNTRLKWISKYFSVIKPHEVKFIIRDFCSDDHLLSFFFDNYPCVKKLTLSCESLDVHLTVAKACSEVEYFSVSSQVFSDELFEIMTETMKKIKHFEVVKDDSNFRAKNLAKYFPNGLESIMLKPYLVYFDHIAILTKLNPEILTRIQLDIECCEQKTLVQILQPLTNVQVLKLYHMENIQISQKLANSFSENVREIYFTKAYELPMSPIIQKIASPKLLTIDFTEVNLLDGNNIEIIAKKCPYLRRFNISWCTKISESSVSKLIQSCHYLQHLNLTGLKCLTDKVFSEYVQFSPIFNENKYNEVKNKIFSLIEQGESLQQVNSDTIEFMKIQEKDEKDLIEKISKLKTLRNLKQLSCLSCNGVNDSILKIIYLINRQANTVNYYGNCMGLYTNQDFFGSM